MVEPPAFALARGTPAVDELEARLAAVYPAPPETDLDKFYADFCEAFGLERPDPGMLSPQDEASIRASMGERPPWEAEIPLAALAAGSFPILVISGTWDDTPPGGGGRGGGGEEGDLRGAPGGGPGAGRRSPAAANNTPLVGAAGGYGGGAAGVVRAAAATSSPAR